MHFTFIAISAFAAGAFAQSIDSASQSELLSVASVLQTALPSSLVQEYLTNSAAVSSELASEFSAGQYPAWFTALPTDVQTYLVPVAAANAPGSISGAPTNSANSTGMLSQTSRTPSATVTRSPSESSSGSAGAQSSGSSTSQGAAPLPTAAVGMGLAGLVGLVGVFAL